jgi:hypothetical protein
LLREALHNQSAPVTAASSAIYGHVESLHDLARAVTGEGMSSSRLGAASESSERLQGGFVAPVAEDVEAVAFEHRHNLAASLRQLARRERRSQSRQWAAPSSGFVVIPEDRAPNTSNPAVPGPAQLPTAAIALRALDGAAAVTEALVAAAHSARSFDPEAEEDAELLRATVLRAKDKAHPDAQTGGIAEDLPAAYESKGVGAMLRAIGRPDQPL